MSFCPRRKQLVIDKAIDVIATGKPRHHFSFMRLQSGRKIACRAGIEDRPSLVGENVDAIDRLGSGHRFQPCMPASPQGTQGFASAPLPEIAAPPIGWLAKTKG